MNPKITITGIDDVMGALDATVAKKALARTYRLLGDSARTRLSEDVRGEYTAMKKKDVDAKIQVQADGDRGVRLLVKSQPINLMDFGAISIQNAGGGRIASINAKKGQLLKRQTRALGVYVTLKNGQKKHIPNAFVAYRKGDNKPYIFISRTGQGRRLYSKNLITASSMIGDDERMKRLDAWLNTNFATVFMHEYDYFIKNADKKYSWSDKGKR